MKSISQYLLNKSNTQLDNRATNSIIRHKQIIISPFSYDNGIQFFNKSKNKNLKFLNNNLNNKYITNNYSYLNSLLQENNYVTTIQFIMNFFKFYRKINKQIKKNLQKNKKLSSLINFRLDFKYLKPYPFQKKYLAGKYQPFSFYNKNENYIQPMLKIGFKNTLKGNSKYNLKKKLLSLFIPNEYRTIARYKLIKNKKKKKKLIFKNIELLNNNLLSKFKFEKQSPIVLPLTPLMFKLIKKLKQKKKRINSNKNKNKKTQAQNIIQNINTLKKTKVTLSFKKH